MIKPLLELRHLETIQALVETGNLSRAAVRVHLTQSALSHQIKQLEEYFGMPLFERKTQPLMLTPAGRRLLQLADTVLGEVDTAIRDLARMAQGDAGTLRIAVECHTCFDWLMPAMDTFRENWPQIEQDLVSGFHTDPLGLLTEGKADVVIVSESTPRPGLVFHPLFRSQIMALLAKDHTLARRKRLDARDFADQTLITYPVPDEMLDLVRRVLRPEKIEPQRRTAELTVAILQLVASKRGIAALPEWAVQSYLDRGYVAARPIGKSGLWSELYAASTASVAQAAFMQDFIATVRDTSFRTLRHIVPLPSAA